MVRLLGHPVEAGERYGKILSPFIQERVRDYREKQSGDPGKREAFLEVLEREAPAWIEEYGAVARAAQVPFADLLEINCAAPLTSRPSCTSLWVGPDRSATGVPMLLKVRDERYQHQSMGYRRIRGGHGMLFGTDPCNMGVGQGCNEHGLAVANNSGGMVPETKAPVGLSDCHVTRLLLEQARDVDEALKIFRRLQRRGSVGLVDGVRGMIFLLLDRRGRGLVIEGDRKSCDTRSLESGCALWTNHWLLPGSARFTKPLDSEHPLQKSSLTRYRRGLELINGKDKLSLFDLEAFSRDEAHSPHSICNGTDAFPWRTVSSFIYRLDPALSLPVRAAPGNPARVPYQDVPLWADETPEDYLLRWTA